MSTGLRERIADRVYRGLLHLVPVDLRRDFGDDMAQMFRDRRRDARGRPWIVLTLWLAAARDLAVEGGRARADRRAERSGHGPTRRRLLESMAEDVRFGARLLVRDRTFTAVALLVLGLGIGANTAAFGIVNVLLLKPRPGHPAGPVVGLYSQDVPPLGAASARAPATSAASDATPGAFRAFSYPEFVQLRERHDVFTALTAHNFAFVGVTEGDRTRQVIVDMVTREFFDVFGAPLVLGRTFTPVEERPGSGAAVAILNYAAWQRRGGTADVLGSTVRVSGRPLTIVGVAERGFGGSLALLAPELWVPVSEYDRLANDFVREGMQTTLADRRTRMLILDAQLRPGVTIASAGPALESLMAPLAAADPAGEAHHRLVFAPLARLGVSTSPRTDSDLTALTVALLSLSGLVLVIASLNLANMLLARGASRQKEFAIRLAIGGGRGRLVRQLLTEGALLAFLGGIVGLAVATWSTSALVAGLAPLIPVTITLDALPDARVLFATFGFCLASVLISSVGPAWTLTRADIVPALKHQAGDVGGRSRLGARHLLVTAQLALSLIMLTGASLFVRSALEAASANPGFSLDRGIIVQVDASLVGRTPVETSAIYARMLDRLRARPDVVAASVASNMPFSGFSDERTVQPVGARLPDGDVRRVSAEIVSVSGDYFRTLGLPLERGHEFSPTAGMTSATRHDAIIDAPLATHLFGSADPLGRSLQYDALVAGQPPLVLDIVGVVPGMTGEIFDDGLVPHLYVPYAQDPRAAVYLHVRTSAPTASLEAALLPRIRADLAGVDADVPILEIGTRAMFRDRGIILAIVRTGARIFAVFGVVALVLAAVGVYGVKAFLVSRRTREIGIRVALGATASRVVWLVAREGLVVALAGLAIGAGLSVVAAAGLRSLMYQQHGADATLMVATIAVLLAASVLAGAIPARRAARIEPMRALRE